jgi:hypothetical protein
MYPTASAGLVYNREPMDDEINLPGGRRGRTRTDRFMKKERLQVDLAVVSLNTAGPVDGYSR